MCYLRLLTLPSRHVLLGQVCYFLLNKEESDLRYNKDQMTQLMMFD